MVYNIGLLGLGTVGRGVVEKLRDDKNFTIRKALVRDPSKQRDVELGGVELVTDAGKIFGDSSLGIIVEAVGGYEPARDFIETSLRMKKHVVTANKAVIAEFPELETIAEQNGVRLLYEAAVGGEIPIIRTLRENPAKEDIVGVRMIINGTTNYMLTEMANGMRYEDALSQAQKLGYAEAKPSFDVDGLDAAQKLAIVASIVSGKWVDWKNIETQGISGISLKDIEGAISEGCRLKLIASLQRNDREDRGGRALELSVKPEKIPYNSRLRVDDVLNAVQIIYRDGTEIYLQGRGAGRDATAKSVVADLYSIIQQNI